MEPPICYVAEQEVVTEGIKMSKGVEPILVTRQEIVVLLKAKLIVTKGVHVAVRARYSEPYLISIMEVLLDEFQGIKAKGFIM